MQDATQNTATQEQKLNPSRDAVTYHLRDLEPALVLEWEHYFRDLDNAQYPGSIRSVLCPGLGTATGALPFEICARQMQAAYLESHLPASTPPGVNDILMRHYALLLPGRKKVI